MHPDLMGRSFKAICLSARHHCRDRALAGFRFARDPRGALGCATVAR